MVFSLLLPVISDYIHIFIKMGKLIIGGVIMTYNDKEFQIQKNIKEIIAKTFVNIELKKDILRIN